MAGARLGRGLAEDDYMKRMVGMTIAALLLAVSVTSAQSLGDVARSARKGKTQQSAANHKYDNDNLPKQDHLSVVGPTAAPSATAENQSPYAGDPQAQAAPASDAKTAAEDRQAATDEWKKKIDEQKKKVETLTHDLDLTQREYKLRAVAMYSDAGNRLRNSGNWDKEDKDFKQQLDEKQKAVDEAKKELDDMKEDARKAGTPSSVRE
jgi:hypothetical protein